MLLLLSLALFQTSCEEDPYPLELDRFDTFWTEGAVREVALDEDRAIRTQGELGGHGARIVRPGPARRKRAGPCGRPPRPSVAWR